MTENKEKTIKILRRFMYFNYIKGNTDLVLNLIYKHQDKFNINLVKDILDELKLELYEKQYNYYKNLRDLIVNSMQLLPLGYSLRIHWCSINNPNNYNYSKTAFINRITEKYMNSNLNDDIFLMYGNEAFWYEYGIDN